MNARATLIAIGGIAIAGAIGFGAYRYGMDRGMQMGTTPSAAPADGRKVLYWHDPMYPNQRFDKPGKSPYMDMQLVPVYADSASGSDGNAVRISPDMQQNLGVRTAEVKRAALATALEAVGSVAYNERDMAVVQARANGFLEKLYVKAALDPVRKGQPLADLYVPEWVAAQEEYLSAKRISSQTQLSGLGSLVEGAKQRMRLAGMSDEQIASIERTGKASARLTITAPIAGIVAELAAREGMTVMAGAPLFRINGLSTVWVNAEVPEAGAAQVRPGAPVQVRATAFPAQTFNGRVGAILPEVNAATRTLKARIEVANPGARLVPGMFASVSFAPPASRETLVVPSEAVITTGTRSVVMVVQGDGKFAPADVEIGTEANGQTEIRKGLQEGQKVVVSGQFLIDSESSLRGSATRMEAPATPASPATPAKAAPQSHHGVGKVEHVSANEVVISHDAIESLKWGPMTMGFAVPKDMHVHVQPGEPVSFDFRQTPDGAFELTKIEARK